MGHEDPRVRRLAGLRQQPPVSAAASPHAAAAKTARGERTPARPHVRQAGQSGQPGQSRVPRAAPIPPAATPPAAGQPGPATRRPSLWGLELQPGWVLLPLRLFLGVTFFYAGVQKLTDAQFFKPGTRDYIGSQIQAFAHGSPIGGLLLHLVLPHAMFFGGLIAYGEIAIGLGTLAGLLARPAAFFGGLLSLLFFLSASWRVYPYFYGADIVFVFAWLTLGLRPHAGLPSLDERAAAWLTQRWRATRARALALFWLFSAPDIPSPLRQPAPHTPPAAVDARARQRHPARAIAARQQSRRTFLTGLGAGIAGTLGLVWLWSALHPAPDTTLPSSTGSAGAATTTTATSQTPATTGGAVIARSSDVPANSATTFTIPSNQDPGVVVHLADGRFVAYDATCTHAGCPVQYDPGSGDLYCPCHGAAFDPAHGGAVLQGPAATPLATVPITVASNGDITLAS